MSGNRNDPAARQKVVLEELDAIDARRERGEISSAEAAAQSNAVVKRVHEETLALGQKNPGRGRLSDRFQLAFAWVKIVLAVLFIGFLTLRYWFGE